MLKEKVLDVPTPLPSTCTVWSAGLGHLLKNIKTDMTGTGQQPQRQVQSTSTSLGLAPFDDEVISQASSWCRLIGCPAGVSHQDHVFIQPICLQLHPDFLVQLNVGAWQDSFCSVRVSVGHHSQSVIPLFRGNVLDHRTVKQRYDAAKNMQSSVSLL